MSILESSRYGQRNDADQHDQQPQCDRCGRLLGQSPSRFQLTVSDAADKLESGIEQQICVHCFDAIKHWITDGRLQCD